MGAVALPETETKTRPDEDEEVQFAPRYRVIIHNDDVTPMDLVVRVLLTVFRLEVKRAMEVMLEAHESGAAHVATMTLEEAELRCEKAHAEARKLDYPLTFTYEPE